MHRGKEFSSSVQSGPHVLVWQFIQCSSEISEPKCASNTRTIRVYVYTHTSIDIRAYAYTSTPIRIRVCVISMYELAYCFFYCGKVIVDLNGHCNCSKNDAQAAPNARRSSCVSSGCVCSPLSNAVTYHPNLLSIKK